MFIVLASVAGLMLLHPPNPAADLDTLGGVLQLVCRSKELQKQLRGLSLESPSEMRERIEKSDAKYSISSMSIRN